MKVLLSKRNRSCQNDLEYEMFTPKITKKVHLTQASSEDITLLHSYNEDSNSSKFEREAYAPPYYSSDVCVYGCMLCKQHTEPHSQTVNWAKVGCSSDLLNAVMAQIVVKVESSFENNKMPTIMVTLENELVKLIPASMKLQAEVSAVRCGFGLNNGVEKVVIEGVVIQEIVEGKASFTGLNIPQSASSTHFIITISSGANVFQTYISTSFSLPKENGGYDVVEKESAKSAPKFSSNKKKSPKMIKLQKLLEKIGISVDLESLKNVKIISKNLKTLSFKTAQKVCTGNEIRERYVYVNQKSYDLLVSFQSKRGVEKLVLNRKTSDQVQVIKSRRPRTQTYEPEEPIVVPNTSATEVCVKTAMPTYTATPLAAAYIPMADAYLSKAGMAIPVYQQAIIL